MKVGELPFMAFRNRRMVEQSGTAGCFKCGKVFPSSEVKDYTDAGQTCCCPSCGHDCVVSESCGYELTEESLKRASEHIFSS